MRHFFSLLLFVFVFFFSGCMSEGNETIVLPDLESGEGSLSAAIPDEIREQFERTMPIYTGNTPPDISGQYLANNFTLTGSNVSGDNLGTKYGDLYLAFIKGTNGKLSYLERQGGAEAGSDNVTVEIIGNNNNFTAYFVASGSYKGISFKQSTIVSGTLTSSGISNFNYGFVVVDIGPDPNDELMDLRSFRTYKDSDGLAAKYTWR